MKWHPALARALWIGCIFGLMSAPARADFAAPLIFPNVFHFALASIILGVGEGLAMALIFHMRMWHAIGGMLLVNFISSLAGLYLATWICDRVMNIDLIHLLNHLLLIHCAVFTLLFLAMALLRWPVCLWMLRKSERKYQTSAYASLAAQFTACIMLFPFFCYKYEQPGFLRVFKLDPTAADGIQEKGSIFFISRNGDVLGEIDLNGKDENRIRDLDLHRREELITPHLRKRSDMPSLQLMRYHVNERPKELRTLDILDLVLWETRTGRLLTYVRAKEDQKSGFLMTDLRSIKSLSHGEQMKQQWHIDVHDYPHDLPVVSVSKAGEIPECRIQLDTPLVSDHAREPTILPGDRVVAELLGNIILIDLNRGKMCRLTEGYCPIVVLHDMQQSSEHVKDR